MQWHRTNETIRKMVRENTGSHFLDSGMAYGYKYQQPIPTQALYWNGDDYTISLTHFLEMMLEQTEESEALQKEFEAWAEERDPEHEASWLGLANEWGEEVYGGRTENTYNYDTDLDQVMQFTTLETDSPADHFIILSVHTGCDVRGGYSKPHVFEVRDMDYFFEWQVGYYCSNENCPNGNCDMHSYQMHKCCKVDRETHEILCECGSPIHYHNAAEGF